MTLLLDANIPKETNNNQTNKNETKQTNHNIESQSLSSDFSFWEQIN